MIIRLKRLYVAAGALINSDAWSAYLTLDRLGYRHEVVNHSIEFVSETGAHTQTIEGIWSIVKLPIKKSLGLTNPDDLQVLLDAWMWQRRYITDRKRQCDAFYKIVDCCNHYWEQIHEDE